MILIRRERGKGAREGERERVGREGERVWREGDGRRVDGRRVDGRREIVEKGSWM